MKALAGFILAMVLALGVIALGVAIVGFLAWLFWNVLGMHSDFHAAKMNFTQVVWVALVVTWLRTGLSSGKR